MTNTYVRENKIRCGPQWQAVEIFRWSENRTAAVRKTRRPKTMLSAPAQKKLNDSRARRYFLQLILANFGAGDYVAHLSYSDKFLPKSAGEAQRCVRRWLDRISYELKKRGLPPLKYICVTAEGDIHQRLHHHVFLKCELDRDLIEEMWWAVKGDKKHRREMLGGCNVDRLKDWSGDGIMEMAKYVARQAKGKKKWTQSKNLHLPKLRRPNDTRISLHRFGTLMEEAVNSDAMQEFVRSSYPGYTAVQIEKVQPDPEHSWGGGLYLLLHKVML